MIPMISIGSTRHIDLIKDRLGCELVLFEGNGLKFKLAEQSEGKFTFITCRLADGGEFIYEEEDARLLFKHFLANVITDVILNHWEEPLVREIIQENYYYFAEEDKDLIYRGTLSHINQGRDGRKDGSLRCIIRKSRVLQKVIEYLSGSNQIILDGFIKFRLKEYVNELREAADKAVDDFLIEREYREFIQLLRYFVEIQEPRYELVHIVIRDGKNYSLFDENLQGIKTNSLEGCVMELSNNEISCDDLFVSMLITLSPRNITIHRAGETQIPLAVETIVNVFEGRVSWCPGCQLCRSGDQS
jgi:putative sporulation protein YtxC